MSPIMNEHIPSLVCSLKLYKYSKYPLKHFLRSGLDMLSRDWCFFSQIQLYNVKGDLVHSFEDHETHLTSITSLNAFHPQQPFLAGANSSGRVFIFKP